MFDASEVIIDIHAKLHYYFPRTADVLIDVEVIPMYDQRLISDKLVITGTDALHPVTNSNSTGRRTLFSATSHVLIDYTASVAITRPAVDIARLQAVPVSQFMDEQVGYVFPSRYCESEKLESFVHSQFAGLQGGTLVAAMCDWIYHNISYQPGTSSSSTTAVDSFVTRCGVCRDFAHILIAFARAALIPARMVSGYALHVIPQDFHAVVEVWLTNGTTDNAQQPQGAWYMIDPTRLAPTTGIARISVGRDATDISFMTIFGKADVITQSVVVSQR